ncbi:little elongation complex subunit 1 [Leuresthes tenuis]|uniref:little elongation complex subunit 1 n=1 Tax=Leuresthes tenuis TaxID=355514 RepID=UPI003B51206A
MMPGDNQYKTAAIAADATLGNCQNCSILHQSLTEYVSSFLALKQKITVSDDAIRLQQQLEELQIRLATLEKKTADYESLQAELEKNKSALKAYEQLSGEMEKLKQENCITAAENKKLEDRLNSVKDLTETQSLENAQLKREKAALENDLLQTQSALKAYEQLSGEMEKLKQENCITAAENKKLEDRLNSVKDLTETQCLENAQLKREKAALENDLLQTQASLNKSQAQADKAGKLMEENAVMRSLKDSLEDKVKLLEDSICKQNHQISQLTREKILLERNIADLQVRLIKLERERCKEYRSATSQTSAPAEPKVDKERVRMLLQNLWACLEPEQSANLPPSAECDHRQVLPSSPHKLQSRLSGASSSASHKISESHSDHVQTQAIYTQLKPSPRAQDAIEHQTPPLCLRGKKQAETRKRSKRSSKEHKPDETAPDKSSCEISLDEIMKMFKPLSPCISPLSDVDPQNESLETGDAKRKDPPETLEDCPPLKEDDSLNITRSTSSHNNPTSSALEEEENVDLMEVDTQECQNISDDKDSGQNESSGLAPLSGKTTNKDDGKMHPQDVSPVEEPASAQLEPASSSSSSTSDRMVLVEDVPLSAESLGASCSVNSDGADSSSAVQNAFEETKEDDSETVTTMDLDSSLRDALGATTVNPECGELLTEGDAIVISEKAEDEQVLAKETDVTAISSEIEEGPLNSCQGSQDGTLFKLGDSSGSPFRDSEMPEYTPSSTGDGMISVPGKNPEERLETDADIQHCGVEGGGPAQGTGGADVTTSPSESNADKKPPSVKMPPVLKTEDDEPHSDQECSDANSKTLKKEDVDNKTMSGKVMADGAPSFSHFPKTVTVDSNSLEDNKHSLCRQLSPTCLLPAVKVEALETHASARKSIVDVDTELTATIRKTPVSFTDKEGLIEKVDVISPDRTDAGITTSVTKNAAGTKGQNGCLESGKEKGASGPAAAQTPECIGHVRSEMGPPLPPVLTPLSTPPKAGKSINPRHAIGKLSFPSPMDGVASPTTPVQAHLTPSSQQFSSSSLNSPVPPNGVPSSPLQFGSATPKHAVPVPGRLPLTAKNSSPSSSTSPSQENSMRILDTMYPELSARARTLSILRGNVSLGICSSESGTLSTTTESQMSGFKTISSTSTAFTKTEMRGEKRPAVSLPQPTNGKCLKLDDSSPGATLKKVSSVSSNSGDETASLQTLRPEQLKSTTSGEPAEENLIGDSLKKIKNQCFDLMPVVQSHLYVGNLPKKPVLRDEEREVISEICQCNSLQADDILLAILNKLRAEKNVLSTDYMQALCRVYTGICRQKRCYEKARILAYSILVEDFPESAKLVLFMVTTWPSFLSHSGSLCQAIHAITKLKAQEALLDCFSKFLGWEKNPPCAIDQLISRTLSELRSGSNKSFIKHSRYGEDLGSEAWECIFTLHLLCSHKKWKWTYENVVGKELWPLLNAWVTQPRNQQEPVSDVAVATIIRLTGRLGQLGLEEKCVSSVVTVSSVMNTFGRQGQTQGIPWEVQLAAVYCIYDLSPCDPKQALDVLAGWRGETTRTVPPAVTSCINQLGSICRQVKS